MTTQDKIQKAVIYCRVSDPKQTTDGDGLASQETRCREFAKHRQLQVVCSAYVDDMSGKYAERPGMRDLLIFLHDQTQPHAVLIDDLSRLARDVEAYRTLRRAISEAGGVLMSPSLKFGEDSDSTLIENLLASVAQHQRQKKWRANKKPHVGTGKERVLGLPRHARLSL